MHRLLKAKQCKDEEKKQRKTGEKDLMEMKFYSSSLL